MGVGVLDMPGEAAARLPGCLREAGIRVEVTTSTTPQRPSIAVTRLRCCRGTDVLYLGWASSPDRLGECRVWYQVPWHSWPSICRRRRQLMAEVVGIIEQNGGYWPFSD
jgi:hypothetical protein